MCTWRFLEGKVLGYKFNFFKDIRLFRFCISCVSFGKLCFSNNLFISSELSNLLAYKFHIISSLSVQLTFLTNQLLALFISFIVFCVTISAFISVISFFTCFEFNFLSLFQFPRVDVQVISCELFLYSNVRVCSSPSPLKRCLICISQPREALFPLPFC